MKKLKRENENREVNREKRVCLSTMGNELHCNHGGFLTSKP